MAELKTKPTKESVRAFISKITDEKRRQDCKTVLDLMADVTGAKPEMWGPGIVGFGRYKYRYTSGREGEWMLTGFSPRKTDLTLYIMSGVEADKKLLARLGEYKSGKSCLYIRRLEDVDLKVLKELVEKSVEKLADQRLDK